MDTHSNWLLIPINLLGFYSGCPCKAKVNGQEPYAYLRHVFAKLPKAEDLQAIEALLPWNVQSQDAVY